ncbi:hypothetical protein LSH36_385g02026 [Paralvinella palmiformis]|uniref:Peptidoglycan recognition protein family domain-containing protein n=1 Tax=Paralvinella palmiformis TaxID=53620 RepID=A0AAD9JDN3_9ANNE|nr:hypothetical protein LSH36_385g02026 [Paralvinella palmiformis]
MEAFWITLLSLLASFTPILATDWRLILRKYQKPLGGSPLKSVYRANSRLRCVADCVDLPFCGSGLYSLSTGLCSLLAEYRSELSLITDSDAYYFSKRPCRKGFRLYSRTDWQASPPAGNPGTLDTPVSFIVLHASVIVRDNQWPDDCGDLDNCFKTMRDMQDYDIHIRSKKWSDIGVNFFLDGSGRFYEGRSWTYNAAYLSVTSRGGQEGFGKHLAITIFGDFHTQEPTRISQAALRAFCACAVENGYVKRNYAVLGHIEDRPKSTYCPGQGLLDMIHRWPLL